MKNDELKEVFYIKNISDIHFFHHFLRKSALLNGLSNQKVTNVLIVFSELATNIIKYAKVGYITVIRKVQSGHLDIVEIVADDKGPGINDISLALQDNFSTGGSLGLGLPAIKRISNDFKVESTIETGTRVNVTFHVKEYPTVKSKVSEDFCKMSTGIDADNWDSGFFVKPMQNGIFSGDAVINIDFDAGLLVAMIDVTGHGVEASKLANRISTLIHNHVSRNLKLMMNMLHSNLQGTLGASVGLFLIDKKHASFEYMGVGNIGVSRCNGEKWNGITKEGIVGLRLPSLYQQSGHLAKGDLFVMYSDGISETLIKPYVKKHDSKVAKQLSYEIVRDLGKAYDDASCFVFRWHG